MKLKNLSLAFSYLSDITLLAWIYFQATSYKNFAKNVSVSIDSPDFQIQFYHILMQSLTFALLLFLSAQTLVYILALRKFRAAYFYLKFFSVFGFALCLYITFTASLFALLPAALYIFGYITFARTFKELTVKERSLPQSPTPQ